MAALGSAYKVRHNEDGVETTPGLEVIVQPPKPIPYDHMNAVANKAGPTEPKRCQYIPYLITAGIDTGLAVDIKTGCVFPDIRLQVFMAGADMVVEAKPKPGEDVDTKAPPPIQIHRKAHKLQLFSNFPVHGVIGYPSQMPELASRPASSRPLDQDIFTRPEHAGLLRRYQRQLLLAENMLQLNLNQVGHNLFSLRWDRDMSLSDRLFSAIRSDIADIEGTRRSEAERRLARVEQIQAAFELELEALRKGCEYYAEKVAAGHDPQAVINRMRANRAASVSKSCPLGDPTIEAEQSEASSDNKPEADKVSKPRGRPAKADAAKGELDSTAAQS